MSNQPVTAMSITDRKARGEPLRFQASVLDLIIVVLGVAGSAGAARYARVFEEGKDLQGQLFYCLGGLAFMGIAIWLVLFLVRAAAGILGATQKPPRRTARAGWRILAATALVVYFAAESASLKVSFATGDRSLSQKASAQLGVFSLCALFFMAGLCLGATPGRARRPESRHRSVARRMLMVVAILAVLAWFTLGRMAFPYLVVVILQVVRDAMHHGPLGGTSVATRLFWAVPASLVSTGACTATAVWLSCAMRRRPASELEESAWAPMQVAIAVVATIALVAASGWLVFATIPMLHELLAAGLSAIIGPEEVGALAMGFGGLGAGIAARAVMGPPDDSQEVPAALRAAAWPWLAGTLGRALRIGLVVALGLVWLLHENNPPRDLDVVPTALAVRLMPLVYFLNEHVFDPALLWHILDLEVLCLLLGLGWLLLQLALLMVRGRVAPFDRVLERPASIMRWCAFTTAFTALCLAALPTLFVGGVVAYHFVLNP
ncbi:MAG TPA: hypothetical protein VGY53_12965 [Isosphaeraceae bacterium]|nr:hypothetical protein [Isosphaeraceae bacterium]